MQEEGFQMKKWGLLDAFYLNVKADTLSDYDSNTK